MAPKKLCLRFDANRSSQRIGDGPANSLVDRGKTPEGGGRGGKDCYGRFPIWTTSFSFIHLCSHSCTWPRLLLWGKLLDDGGGGGGTSYARVSLEKSTGIGPGRFEVSTKPFFTFSCRVVPIVETKSSALNSNFLGLSSGHIS